MMAQGKFPGKETVQRYVNRRRDRREEEAEKRRQTPKIMFPDQIENVGQYRTLAKMVRNYERTVPILEREG